MRDAVSEAEERLAWWFFDSSAATGFHGQGYDPVHGAVDMADVHARKACDEFYREAVTRAALARRALLACSPITRAGLAIAHETLPTATPLGTVMLWRRKKTRVCLLRFAATLRRTHEARVWAGRERETNLDWLLWESNQRHMKAVAPIVKASHAAFEYLLQEFTLNLGAVTDE